MKSSAYCMLCVLLCVTIGVTLALPENGAEKAAAGTNNEPKTPINTQPGSAAQLDAADNHNITTAGSTTHPTIPSISTTTPIPTPTNTTTTKPTTAPTTIHTTTVTTPPTTTQNITTATPSTTPSTTTVTSTTPSSTTLSSSTAAAKTTATPPSSKDRHFDGLSFFGGIILATCLMAIAVFAWKFYRQCNEGNYRTL